MALVADKLAEFFASKGCTHAFGLVGGANLAIYRAFADKLHVIPVCHEQAAAIAANYYYRVSRRIAPCLVTNGGGSLNAITGVADAHMDSVPLFVISGNEQLRFIKGVRGRTIGFQGVDPAAMVQNITKRAVCVDNPLGARLAWEAMYEDCLNRRPGAVWLDIPQDVATAEAQ